MPFCRTGCLRRRASRRLAVEREVAYTRLDPAAASLRRFEVGLDRVRIGSTRRRSLGRVVGIAGATARTQRRIAVRSNRAFDAKRSCAAFFAVAAGKDAL